jgi:hypothetical protein
MGFQPAKWDGEGIFGDWIEGGIQPSLRDLEFWDMVPNVETLGYFRTGTGASFGDCGCCGLEKIVSPHPLPSPPASIRGRGGWTRVCSGVVGRVRVGPIFIG